MAGWSFKFPVEVDVVPTLAALLSIYTTNSL